MEENKITAITKEMTDVLKDAYKDAGLFLLSVSAKKEEQMNKYLYLLPIMCYTICSFIDLINDGGE